MLQEGDKVRLNVKRIRAHPDFKKKTIAYQAFVGANYRKHFTVQYAKDKNPNIFVELKEAPKYLWWVGDLIKVKGVND